MRKRGGAGTLRKKCVARICAAPVSSDARPPRVTPTPPRSSPPPNTPLPEFGHESQPELLEVWNEQQRLRNSVPPRWAPAGERVVLIGACGNLFDACPGIEATAIDLCPQRECRVTTFAGRARGAAGLLWPWGSLREAAPLEALRPASQAC